MGLLKADRTEKEAGRGGSSAWRVVISALGQASISEAAWPVLEAKLIEFLDKDGPAAAPATAPQAAEPLRSPLQPLKLFATMPLPWPIFKESELGASKDKSGWRAFANAEHVNLWRFKRQCGEAQRQLRCDEVSKRWNIYKAPAKMLADLQGSKGTSGLRQQVHIFLNGPSRKPSGGFTPPKLEDDGDRAKAEQFEKQMQAMYVTMEAKKREVETELEAAQKPVPVRLFELVRKPQLDRTPEPVLPYGTKPEDYVIKPSDSGATTTPSGSPSKRPKIVMVDERYQKLLVKAQREWKAVKPTLDPPFEAIQNFLNPTEDGDEAGAAAALGAVDDDLGDVECFEYAAPEVEPEADESDLQASIVLQVLYSLAADAADGEVDSATLLAECKVKVSEDAVGNLADTDEADFELILNDLFEVGLISGAKAAIVLTSTGKARVEREMKVVGAEVEGAEAVDD